jgi:excisionase family DNA binding protein
MNGNSFLTIKDLAAELQIKPSTLYAWVGQGKIPCTKVHRLIRFRREEIDAWLDALQNERVSPRRIVVARDNGADIDTLIARVKRDVYTASHGEARPISGPRRKEILDGAI